MVSTALALPAAAALAEDPPPTPTSSSAEGHAATPGTPSPLGAPGWRLPGDDPFQESTARQTPGVQSPGTPSATPSPGTTSIPLAPGAPSSKAPDVGAPMSGAAKNPRPHAPRDHAPGRQNAAQDRAAVPGTTAKRNPRKTPRSGRPSLQALRANEDARIAKLDNLIERLEKIENFMKSQRRQVKP